MVFRLLLVVGMMMLVILVLLPVILIRLLRLVWLRRLPLWPFSRNLVQLFFVSVSVVLVVIARGMLLLLMSVGAASPVLIVMRRRICLLWQPRLFKQLLVLSCWWRPFLQRQRGCCLRLMLLRCLLLFTLFLVFLLLLLLILLLSLLLLLLLLQLPAFLLEVALGSRLCLRRAGSCASVAPGGGLLRVARALLRMLFTFRRRGRRRGRRSLQKPRAVRCDLVDDSNNFFCAATGCGRRARNGTAVVFHNNLVARRHEHEAQRDRYFDKAAHHR